MPESAVTNYKGIESLKLISSDVKSGANIGGTYAFILSIDVFLQYHSDETHSAKTNFWRLGTIEIDCLKTDTAGNYWAPKITITDITTFNDPIFFTVYDKGEPYRLGGGYVVHLPQNRLTNRPATLYSFEFISKQWTKNLLQLKDISLL